MSDRIEVRGLRVVARCGALPEEEVRPQPLEIDLDLALDLAAAGASDQLGDTVDYGEACAVVERVAASGHVTLLEHLAARMADALLVDPRVEAVSVAVRKLRPPLPHDVATVGVRITRRR